MQEKMVLSMPNDPPIFLRENRQHAHEIQDTTIMNSTILERRPDEITDYSEILKAFGLSYRTMDYYLQVGEITRVQGWILHISITISQTIPLFEKLLPYLIKENVPFKIPCNKIINCNLLEGSLGYTQIGKIVCIYAQDDEKCNGLAKELILLTQLFKGPSVPTDIKLGGGLYTRYGSFNPIIVSDSNGKESRYIYNSSGNLVKDAYTIPFSFPKGIIWPFKGITTPIAPKKIALLNGTYKPIVTVKADAKGRVIKALYFKRFLQMCPCIIKEGKINMWSDNTGRDMHDRVKWQREVHIELQTDIPLPKLIDFFIDKDDAYLVLEFVSGSTLNAKIVALYQDGVWFRLSTEKKLLLFNYFVQILSIVESLHKKGYFHRDLNPMNFIIDKESKVYLIDLELAYCFFSKRPLPPFSGGTPGFMAPEQDFTVEPTVKEDIYAIGALMVVLFTGFPPIKFDTSDSGTLIENLYLFNQDKSMASMIAACLSINPDERPRLDQIKSFILNCRDKLNFVSGSETFEIDGAPNFSQLKDVINNALKALVSPIFLSNNQIWHSRTLQNENYIGNFQVGKSHYGGLYQGIGGVLYLLGKAKAAGYEIDILKENYQRGWEFIRCNYLNKLPNISAGLFAGGAGIALSIATGIEAELLEKNEELVLQIQNLLQLPPEGINISSGIAGKGIAILQCRSYLKDEFIRETLQQYVSSLLKSQLGDGAWIISTNQPEKRGRKLTGFAHGVAGIAYFLLEYFSCYPNEEVKKSILKALNWLIEKTQQKDIFLHWHTDANPEIIGRGIDEGIFGISLTFIRANEILKLPVYKQIVEKTLRAYPFYTTLNNVTCGSGITGLGEVYLEAYRVFRTSEWMDRAMWISNILVHTCIRQSDNSVYWLMATTNTVTADFMTGNSGVIYFLMRCFMSDQLRFPFYAIKPGINY